jgi:hypothetical protein
VAVEKLICGKLAENSSRQDALQTIFWTGETFSITGFDAVCAENEFFNSHPLLSPIDYRHGARTIREESCRYKRR